MIFKLQRPIVADDRQVVVYDKKREHVLMLPMSAALGELFGERFKIYAEGTPGERVV